MKNPAAGLLASRILFAAGFLCTGLFSDAAACLFSALYAGLFILQLIREKKQGVRVYTGTPVLFLVLPVYGLAVTLWAVDRGMNLIGFGRYAGILFWTLTLMQYEKEERYTLLSLLPDLMALEVLLALPGRLPALKSLFYVAGRYGGTLQYPNTFAMLCMAALVILAMPGCSQKQWFGSTESNRKKGRILRIVEIFLLACGVFLSGSRTGFLLFIIGITALFFLSKKDRVIFAAALILPAAAVLYAGMTGDLSDVGRFLTISGKESTLLGRLLYWKDGLRILKAHPFGLGYLGYYYLEPLMQTGYYSVRMIHNDLLQIALDLGIIPAIVLAAGYIVRIIRKSTDPYIRLLLILMGLHFLVDFDLGFLSVWYLIILIFMLEQDGKEMILPAAGKRLLILSSVPIACFSLYLGVGLIPFATGNARATLAMVPFDTEAGEQVLRSETDPEKAEQLAESILSRNSYIASAWEVCSLTALRNKDYERVISDGKQAVLLQKYEIKAYEDYLELLSNAVSLAVESGSEEEIRMLLNAVIGIPDMLEQVKAQTDPIAYEIRDVPVLELSDEYRVYIEQAKSIMEE